MGAYGVCLGHVGIVAGVRDHQFVGTVGEFDDSNRSSPLGIVGVIRQVGGGGARALKHAAKVELDS